MKKTTLVLASLLAGCPLAMAQQAPYSNAPTMSDLYEVRQTDISQSNYQAIQALRQMEDFILSLKRFDMDANVNMDVILKDNTAVDLTNSVNLKVDRPNKVYAKISNGTKTREIFYNGTQLTLYAPQGARYYTTVDDVPVDLNSFFVTLRDKYGIRLPLMDMLYSGNPADADAFHNIKSAYYLGEVAIEGVMCRHYTYHTDAADFQVWIEKGVRTLPRKISVTDLKANGNPRYTAVMKWNLSPATRKNMFTFRAPRGATPIVIEEIIIQNNN